MKIVECKDCKSMFLVLSGEGKMTEVKANSVDASLEKHVPVVTISESECRVVVGEVSHPMTEAHLIDWILVETTNGTHVKNLTAQDAPEYALALSDGEKVLNVYANCNLHGLWKASL